MYKETCKINKTMKQTSNILQSVLAILICSLTMTGFSSCTTDNGENNDEYDD